MSLFPTVGKPGVEVTGWPGREIHRQLHEVETSHATGVHATGVSAIVGGIVEALAEHSLIRSTSGHRCRTNYSLRGRLFRFPVNQKALEPVTSSLTVLSIADLFHPIYNLAV
jgi:hypothetical protein